MAHDPEKAAADLIQVEAGLQKRSSSNKKASA
jgi:hypothetical protein